MGMEFANTYNGCMGDSESILLTCKMVNEEKEWSLLRKENGLGSERER